MVRRSRRAARLTTVAAPEVTPARQVANPSSGIVNPAVSGVDLESPTKWIEDLMRKIPKYQLELAGSREEFLKRICRRNNFVTNITEGKKGNLEENVEGEEDNGQNEDVQVSRMEYGTLEWLSTIMNLAFLRVQIGALGEGNRLLKLCRVVTNSDSTGASFSPSHRRALEYLIETGEGVLADREISNGVLQNTDALKLIPRLKQTWDGLQGDPKSVAVVEFVRGQLASLMNLDDDVALNSYRKAAEAESDFYIWHKMIYRTIRMKRRSGGYIVGGPPKADELDSCEKAYNLRPDLPENVLDFAIVRKDGLMSKPSLSEAAAVIQLLENVVGMVPSHSVWAKEALLHLVEMYTAKGLGLDESLAKQTILRCLTQWPRSSMVLHKGAKFFQTGGSSGIYKDDSHAEKLFKEAVQYCPGNFACVMDALRHLGKLLKRHDDMIAIIDKCLSRRSRSTEVQKLLTLRGVCLWLHPEQKSSERKEMACRDWIRAVTSFPKLAVLVQKAILGGRNELFGSVKINAEEVSKFVGQIYETDGNTETKTIAEFRKALSNGSGRKLRRRLPASGPRARHDKNSKIMTKRQLKRRCRQ